MYKFCLPTTLNLGTLFAFTMDRLVKKVVVMCDHTQNIAEKSNNNSHIKVGVAAMFGMFVLRTGVKQGWDNNLVVSFGGGLKFKNIAIDYASMPYKNLGVAHNVSSSSFF
ncbi:MAG: hypothetical protein WC955_01540 [Elusimicrobiota bacterium]